MSALLSEADNAENIVIVCHGFTGSKEGGGRALEMGDSLLERGISTLLFDFAGCGESDGKWHDISLTAQTEDLSAVVEWCRCRGYSRLILNGRSFGGSTVINYAACDKNIGAVCTWAAPARLNYIFEKLAGGKITGSKEDLVPISGEEGTVYLKKNFFFDLKKHNLLKKISFLQPCRLLIIHGSDDQSVPVEDARLLYQAAATPKVLKIIEGADHRFSNHTGQVWETFFEWLNTEAGGFQ